jgi:hypothetical protein
VKTYDHLVLHLVQVKDGTAELDYRRFHLLSEHKGTVLRRLAHLADTCDLHEPLADTLHAYRELDHQVRQFRLRLLFLRPERAAGEAALGLEFLTRVREPLPCRLRSLTAGTLLTCFFVMERVTRIELARSAWEATVPSRLQGH